MKMMKMDVTFAAVIFVLCWISCFSTVDEIERLTTDLLKSYNKKIHPPYNSSETLYINCSFILISINEYDDVNGVLSIVGGPDIAWFDYRLEWNPHNYSGLSYLTVPRSDIWFPQLFVVNTAEELKGITLHDSIPLRIYADGLVEDSVGGHIKTICTSDMTHFPFDKQRCEIRLAAWNYYGQEISILPFESKVNMRYFSTNNIWHLEDTHIEHLTMGEFDGLVKVVLVLKRRPLYFCISMLAPILLLAILNPLVFILPPESGERVSYAVTIFLSVAVFMTLVNDHLPKSSAPMSNTSFFLLSSVSFSALIIIITIISMRLHLHKQTTSKPKGLKILCSVLSLDFLQRIWCCKKKNAITEIKEKTLEMETMVDEYKMLAEKFDRIALGYSAIFIIITIFTFSMIIINAP